MKRFFFKVIMRPSKCSLRSSTSSSRSIYQSEEITRLEKIIGTLERNNEALKSSLESRDKAIGMLAHEKEKLNEELKCAQRTNRNLYQQLTDEREIHYKEKEYLFEDIKRLSIRRDSNLTLVDHGKHKLFSSLEQEIQEKNEIICNICNKYLKIKSSKTTLQKKFIMMQQQSQKMCENIILILQENRWALDSLLNTLLTMSHITKSSKKFIKLLKINSRLHYENTQLKIRITCGNEICMKKGLSVPNIASSKNTILEEHDIIAKKCMVPRSFCSNLGSIFGHSEGFSNLSTFRAITPNYTKEIRRSKSDTNLVRFK